MSKIIDIISREILDSRGNPTIETDVITLNGGFGRASIPSGASKGEKEALELRDNDINRYNGLGVLKAVSNVNTIIKNELIGVDVQEQEKIDELLNKLDGTSNKCNLGANAILSVSLACLKAAADENDEELYEHLGNSYSMPVLMMNILNGGVHANNNISFQEFMIVPNSEEVKERIRMGSEIFHSLKELLNDDGYFTTVGDEGGFAPNLKSNEEALKYIVKAIDNAGYKPGKNVNIALDVAASEIYDKDSGKYLIDNKSLSKNELFKYYEYLIDNYPIISIEDPVEENDFDGLKEFTSLFSNRVQVVGDDLFVTNVDLLQKAIDKKSGNAILIKLNQIGTVTETLNTIKKAKDNNYKTIISHRSGETEDTFISDFAVGLNLGQMKAGSLSRVDRVSKYNRLIRINEELN